MSVSTNKALVKLFIDDVFNNHNPSAIEKYFAKCVHCIRLYWSREGKSSNSINTKIERSSSNTMFPNFLIPKLRQLTMRDVIHISDRNTTASRIRFVQLS